MAAFNSYVNCDTDTYERINLVDIQKHSLYPFKELPLDKLCELPDYYSCGSKKEITVQPHLATEHYPYEYYEALCDYNIIRKLRLYNPEQCLCVVKHDLTQAQSVALMVQECLRQVEHPSTSEKAYAYNLLQEYALDKALEICGECKTTFDKLSRLTFLLPPILQMVDNKTVSVQSGEQISYLDTNNQTVIYDYLLTTRKKLTLPIAIALNRYVLEIGTLDKTKLDALFGSTV